MRFSRIEGRHVSSPKSGLIPLSLPLSRLRFEIGPFGRIWPKQTVPIRFYHHPGHLAESSSAGRLCLLRRKASITQPGCCTKRQPGLSCDILYTCIMALIDL